MLPSYNFGIMGIKIHHYKDPYLNSQYKVSNKNPYHKESTIFLNFRGSFAICLLFLLFLLRWEGQGCFCFEGQYSILKNIISTCVLSYIGARES